MGKRLSKYIASFDYFDKYLFFLPATSCRISIASFAGVIGVLVGIASASFSFEFSIILHFAFKKYIKNNTQNKKA